MILDPRNAPITFAIEVPQIEAVIVSDLVYNHVHPWLAEGRSKLWLAALHNAKRRFGSAKVLYAGHGAAGSTSIIDEQVAYINAVRDMAANTLKEDPGLSDARKAAIQQTVRTAYKNWPLETMIDLNTASLASEARSESWKSPLAVT
jgi:hypothetical protein